MSTDRLRKATAWWIEQGITIGWCDGKAPTPMPHGHKGYTSDLDALWNLYRPVYNLGGRPAPHHLVLDIDPRNGGFDTVTKLGLTPPPGSMVIRTGSGGYHVWFSKPSQQKVRGQLGPGIDIKTHTGQILLPPSVHPDTRQEYTFQAVHSLHTLPPLPDRLKRLAYAKPQTPAGSRLNNQPPKNASKRMQGLYHSIANAQPGSRATTAYARTIYALEEGLGDVECFVQAAEASGLAPAEARKAVYAARDKYLSQHG